MEYAIRVKKPAEFILGISIEYSTEIDSIIEWNKQEYKVYNIRVVPDENLTVFECKNITKNKKDEKIVFRYT